MEHNTIPIPYGVRPGEDGWTPYGAYEGVEDSRLQDVDQKLNSKLPHWEWTTTWRSTSCNTRGKPRTLQPWKTRTRIRLGTRQDLRVRRELARTGNLDKEGATHHLVTKIREDKEVKVVRMSQPETAKCGHTKATKASSTVPSTHWDGYGTPQGG